MQPVIPNWRTSSYTETQNCVELADNDPNKVMIRDTKGHDRGTMAIQRDTWRTFVQYAKRT
ncbi:DUF397 domain-containing protein [Streptomyces sp. ME02-8801-2C]|uniref:DUF397 domain-containing protein n=1 Tax=Streptomyces sp. ME02-8801-2C TaxID=3028680 RepID=UPI0029BDA5DE|nr:DUF397 domain-containing protein [Streptomyces sp. ME02-8801-2C]MDX3457479.1 DUF397 domain-containing protein [Streptomyces sp. ME02-8801-2C]